MIAAVKEQLGSYSTDFGNFLTSATGRDLPWLRRLREDAFARFAEVGFPTSHDEDWRFTETSPITRSHFQLASMVSSRSLEAQVAAYQMPGVAGALVFVNGCLAPELSSRAAVPGAVVKGLAQQIGEDATKLEPYLGRYLNIERDAFCKLNTAFLQDGAYIHIGRGVAAELPVHLLFVSVGDEVPKINYPRNLIVAEDGSELTVIEEYVSLGAGAVFCNAATELVAGNGAVVSHYRIEREAPGAFHISTLRIQQSRDTVVASHSVLLGGALVRNNVHPVLAGEGGECLISGLYLGSRREHLDNYMLVEHVSPHCASRQFYNGILDDQAHGVFHGRIIVHKDAQRTDAKQTNRNLLLSDDAQIDTKPQLEIFADDVKCTHGATIGQIEENALFYLRTRGIDELTARRMLLLAFASECLDRMNGGPARTHVEALIQAHLIQMATTADAGCGYSGPQVNFRDDQPRRREEMQ